MEKIKINDCWNSIGVWSQAKARCPELKKLTHCHNCPVYSNAGRQLLDRNHDVAYQEEWTRNLEKPRVEKLTNSKSALAFRLGDEWFALHTTIIREVTYCSNHHSLPHRKNRVLRGIVNVRGELLLCVSLGYLFKLQKGEKEHESNKAIHQRYIVIGDNEEYYTFPASEVRNTLRYDVDTIQKPPSTLAESASSYVLGIILYEDTHIALINSELLFNALHRSTG
jgi:chemotaxis-related protein WspD